MMTLAQVAWKLGELAREGGCRYDAHDMAVMCSQMADAVTANLSQPQHVAQGEAVAWFPTLSDGSILRHFSDGTPVPANITKEGAEQSRLFHLGSSGNPVVPLFATPTIPTGHRVVPVEPTEAMIESACEAIQEDSGMTPWDSPSWEIEGKRDHYRKHIRAAITAALTASPSAGGV